MENINLIDSFAEFKELKNIDRATLMRVLEDIFRNMLIKRYGTDENFDIIINIDKGDLEIWRNRTVVEDAEFENPNTQISLTDAKKIDSDYEVGEEVTDEVKFKDFGRRSVLALRQNLSARILELEKDHIFTKYKEKVGQIVTGEVYQVWKKEILVLDDEGNELILPKQEQIPSDFFKKGDTIRSRGHPGRNEKRFSLHHSFQNITRVPREIVRERGAGNIRRSYHDQKRGTGSGRTCKSGSGIL